MMGAILEPEISQYQPNITWKTDKDGLYTLYMAGIPIVSSSLNFPIIFKILSRYRTVSIKRILHLICLWVFFLNMYRYFDINFRIYKRYQGYSVIVNV